jgi:hypothetical protein
MVHLLLPLQMGGNTKNANKYEHPKHLPLHNPNACWLGLIYLRVCGKVRTSCCL